MSRWNGRMGRGAGKALRMAKREEAAERDADFEANIARIMREQNVSRSQAYPVAASIPRMAQAKRRARGETVPS